MKLDIGGGTNKIDPSFTSVDIRGGDVTAQMWELPFADGSVEFIWSSHALEHVGFQQVLKTLKEWFRVLQPGTGWAIIQVPNFDYVAQYWLTGPDRVWAEMIVFGLQTHEGEFHKSAFTATTLRTYLEEAGFKVAKMDITWNYDQETLRAVCTKGEK
jgi:predicted SAM-dependent methyltransferase